VNPKNPLPRVDPGFYSLTVPVDQWGVDERWRPAYSMPVRPGWLLAMLSGHATVAAGLSIDVPILVLTSNRSHLSAMWSKEMRSSDVVLDVEILARRALQLGPVVTIARIPGAVHDVVLSKRKAREQAYAEMRRWARGYLSR
jgi:alpha-beta hydrolase superfamily lysophospholipase